MSVRPPTRRQIETARIEACHCASYTVGDDTSFANLWTAATFFEAFILYGSEGTREAFGPKERVALRVVNDG